MKTVSGLFDDYSDARAAVSALEDRGVPSDDISIVSNNVGDRYSKDSNAAEGAGTGAGLGAAVGGIGGLLTGLGVMAVPGVGPVVAAGWLAATAAGAAAGAVAGGAAGGLIGAMTESGVPEEHAHVYAEGVRRGGAVVTARVDESLYADAQAILRRGSWVDPEQRRAAYLEQGWTRFDEELDPYTPEEIEKERLRYRL
ncbi:general stress protein [Sinorhizobium sp. GL28]|uniref:general stress protein n=1 Tax=Sinorhizobium sp. GL28 TaxID=1358418 RepID=UPI00071C29E0|nr:general stress protein [Sinorhizobium sp. GL28]KSV88508.1 membrane protein [Sinorhizobium sp. GL28]